MFSAKPDVSAVPVSYTHLDVYKRQGYTLMPPNRDINDVTAYLELLRKKKKELKVNYLYSVLTRKP